MGPKSLRSCSMSSVIPIHIFASEILPRLPPSTLLRFKCLNKFFYDYISSTKFIDLQVHHSFVSHTSSPLIVFIAQIGARQCLYLLDVDSPESPARYLEFPVQHRSLTVVGCCNGLLCLKSSAVEYRDAGCYAIIVNPSTGSILSNISLSIGIAYKSCIGFGYHNLDKDYKLVVVEYQYHREPPNLKTLYRKVSIFSMKSSSWRCIETACLGSLPLMCDSQIWLPIPDVTCALIDNYLIHWLFKSSAGNRSLVCFNLEKEGWVADIPLPDFDDYDHDMSCDVGLGVLDGCLCFSVYEYYVYYKFNVWIMKVYGVHASWTKLIIDIPGHCEYYPILACQHAAIKEILLVKRWPNKPGIQTYVWYNIRDKTTKELQVSRAPTTAIMMLASPELVARSLCLGSLANCFGDCQTQKCKGTPKWMDIMKIDDQVKILQANMNNNVISS